MCSVATARELGIAQSQWVFLHGMAEGRELDLSCRDDPAHSPMAAMVARRALEIAQLDIDEIGSLDIYSCFPCAITTVAEPLGLPTDGSRALTSTGGLPFFGGPGNNYSMHALAEAVGWARRNPNDYAMVTANGGMLSKHASGIYSTRPGKVDWGSQVTTVSNETLRQRRVAADPRLGSIVSYTVHFGAEGNPHAIMLGETEAGERFVARTAADDLSTAKWMLAHDPTGCSVTVTPPDNEKLYFQIVH
jgi:acetyl-CoA C-acetyltransferase